MALEFKIIFMLAYDALAINSPILLWPSPMTRWRHKNREKNFFFHSSLSVVQSSGIWMRDPAIVLMVLLAHSKSNRFVYLGFLDSPCSNIHLNISLTRSTTTTYAGVEIDRMREEERALVYAEHAERESQ